MGSAKAATPAMSPGTASHSDRPSFIARPQITAASSTISAKGALEGWRSRAANSAPSISAAISAMPRPAAMCCASCSALRLPLSRKSVSIAEISPAQRPISSASPSTTAAAAAIVHSAPLRPSCTASAAASATA